MSHKEAQPKPSRNRKVLLAAGAGVAIGAGAIVSGFISSENTQNLQKDSQKQTAPATATPYSELLTPETPATRAAWVTPVPVPFPTVEQPSPVPSRPTIAPTVESVRTPTVITRNPDIILPESFTRYFEPVPTIQELIRLSEEQGKPFFPLVFTDPTKVEMRKKIYNGQTAIYEITSSAPITLLSNVGGRILNLKEYTKGGINKGPDVVVFVTPDAIQEGTAQVYKSIQTFTNNPNINRREISASTAIGGEVTRLQKIGEFVKKGDPLVVFRGSPAFKAGLFDYPANTVLFGIMEFFPNGRTTGATESSRYSSQFESYTDKNGKTAILLALR